VQPAAIQYAALGCIALFGGGAGVNAYGAAFSDSQSGATFHFVMAALSLYLLAECLHHLQRADAMGLLAPPFLASILHFFLAYVMPSAGTLIDPWILDRFAMYYVSQSEQLTETVPVLGLAAFCMWRGYGLALRWAATLRWQLQGWSALRRSLEPSLLPVLGLQFVYFALVAYAISLGIFGMTGSQELREYNVELLGVLNVGLAAGSLSLLLLLAYVFRKRAQGHRVFVLSLICGLLVCLHLTVGAMSGFKSQIVMPFVMLTFSRFIATRRVSLAFVSAACAALFVAYQIIEPFRAYIGQNELQGASSVSNVLDALQKSQEQKDLIYFSSLPWGTRVVSRFDLTGMTSVGLAFANDSPLVAEKSAEFAESLYLAPLLAYVPRALWPGKPTYSSGVWFNNMVLGRMEDIATSVGMGPVTWLFIMGGIAGVALGFLGIGLVQAVMFEAFGRSGAGGFIVFLAAAPTLTMIPTDVGPAFIGMLQILPFAFIAQMVLLKQTSHSMKAFRQNAVRVSRNPRARH